MKITSTIYPKIGKGEILVIRHKYNPNQPRDEKGSSTGGQWTKIGKASGWKGSGNEKIIELSQRTGLSRNDERLRNLYALFDENNGAEFSKRNDLAWTRDAPPNVFYHVSREGLSEGVQSEFQNDIGRALYVGQDPIALGNFYGKMQGYEDYKTYAFKIDNLKTLDIREWKDKEYFEGMAKKTFPKSKTPLGDLARSKGYDAIRYFDPLATGDEWAILNYDKIEQLGRVK